MTPRGGRRLEAAPASGRAARRQPTLETVAGVSGFSRATVSRVINGSPSVDPEIRRRIEEAIDQVGYVPNRAARSLVTRRTDSVALVVREAVEFGVADAYLSSIVIAASQSLVGTGFQLTVMMARNDADQNTLAHYVRGGHVDGVLLVSVHDDDPLPGQLVRARVPVVIGGRTSAPVAGTSYVDVDNLGGAGDAGRRLVATGRRHLATVAGPVDMRASTDRLHGFRSAVRDAGLAPPTVAYGDYTRAAGERAMREILDRDPAVDAVFAANDLMAAGALRVLKEAGRQVPGDVAVVGFDDVELGLHTEPPLTTVHQPIAEQAGTMVELVLALLDGRSVENETVLPTHLVVRVSG